MTPCMEEITAYVIIENTSKGKFFSQTMKICRDGGGTLWTTTWSNHFWLMLADPTYGIKAWFD